jgi:hypothetical protein
MKLFQQAGLVAVISRWLLLGCASGPKQAEVYMVPVAVYKLSDEHWGGLAFRTLHAHGIWPGGYGDAQSICVEVRPSQAARARRILRRSLSELTPEERERSYRVVSP